MTDGLTAEMRGTVAKIGAAVELEIIVRRALPMWVCAYRSAAGLLADTSDYTCDVQAKLYELAKTVGSGWKDAVQAGTRAGVYDTRCKGTPVIDGSEGWSAALIELVLREFDNAELQLRRDMANVQFLPFRVDEFASDGTAPRERRLASLRAVPSDEEGQPEVTDIDHRQTG
jgi:hypothetical protein